MKSPAIEDLILSFLASQLPADMREELGLDSHLIAEGYLDSIGMMRLIHHLESRLGIKIPPQDLVPRNFVTVKAMISYLMSGRLAPAPQVPP